MKIMLSGGGTLGPVTPLLALVEYWRAIGEPVDIVWVGTHNGPERGLVEAEDIRFHAIPSVKLPRYATLYWLVMPFIALRSLFAAWKMIGTEQPDVIVSAGGYVSVPLVILGRLRGVASWVHQQDLAPGLANKIMAWFANKISVTFSDAKDQFPSKKTVVTGNSVRLSMTKGSKNRALQVYGLDPDRMTIVALGGGTGSSWINQTLSAISDRLAQDWQVLHITGKGKADVVDVPQHHYIVRPLVEEDMEDVYALADVVLCRAGMGTITELAAVGKPAIVVPMPATHQEMNALFLYEHQAAVIIDQTETTPQILLGAIRSVLRDEKVRGRIASNLKLAFPKDGTKKIADGIVELAREADSSWSDVGAAEPFKQVAQAIDRGDIGGGTIDEIAEDDESIQEQISRILAGSDDTDDGEESLFVKKKGDDESPHPFESRKLSS